jgi:hypothetical protein
MNGLNRGIERIIFHSEVPFFVLSFFLVYIGVKRMECVISQFLIINVHINNYFVD